MGNASNTKSTTTAVTEADGPATGSATAPLTDRLKFELLRSGMYHDMRFSALIRAHRICLFLTVLLGSGAIAAFGASYPGYGQLAGLAVAIIGAAQLVWDFGGGARDHQELRRRFYVLLADVEAGCDTAEVTAQMTAIFADEPPVKHWTNKRAHNRAGLSCFGEDFNRA